MHWLPFVLSACAVVAGLILVFTMGTLLGAVLIIGGIGDSAGRCLWM